MDFGLDLEMCVAVAAVLEGPDWIRYVAGTVETVET
jgi:hypothetical protein